MTPFDGAKRRIVLEEWRLPDAAFQHPLALACEFPRDVTNVMKPILLGAGCCARRNFVLDLAMGNRLAAKRAAEGATLAAPDTTGGPTW